METEVESVPVTMGSFDASSDFSPVASPASQIAMWSPRIMLPTLQPGFNEAMGLPNLRQLNVASIDQLIMLQSHLSVAETQLRFQEAAIQAVRQSVKLQLFDRKIRIGAILL